MADLCVTWNSVDTNIRDHFRKLREDKKFLDVTLATEDGEQIQAHRSILFSWK